MLIACDHCQSKIRVPDSAAGKKGKCPKCGNVITVPAVEEQVAVPAAPPSEVPSAALPAPSGAAEPVAPLPTADSPAAPSENPTVAGATPQLGTETRALDAASPASAGAVSYAFLAPPQTADELGRLGPYRVLQVLGRGGMGVVFLAEDVRLGRRVALKAMLPEIAAQPAARERFLREAQTAAAIEHDHIVAIFQVDEDRGVPYIAMPLLKGCSLEDWLRRRPPGPLPLPLLLLLARQIAEGLAAAHAHGLIHRDIKPANIFLQERESGPGDRGSGIKDAAAPTSAARPPAPARVKILDFGLARSSAGEQHLTLSGMIVGTPAYMAPEQARSGNKVDARADLFSLGVVLYRLCTGMLPFKGDDMISTLMALAMEQPLPPCALNPELPAALSDLVMRLLEKDPERRLGSADAVVQAIEALENGPVAATAVAEEPLLLEPTAVALPVAPPLPREDEEDPEDEFAPRRRRTQRDEDDDDTAEAPPGVARDNTGLSLASMICGIVGVVVSVFSLACCCFGPALTPLSGLAGLAAIGLGVVGMKQGGRNYAYTGIGLGAAALALTLGYLAFLLLGMSVNLAGNHFQPRF